MMRPRTLRRTKRSRRTSKRRARQRAMLFEPLEPRLLLSAVPFFTAGQTAAALDLILRHEHDAGADSLVLVDRLQGTVASKPVSEIADVVEIVGSALDDRLTLEIDPDFLATKLPHGIRLDAGGGNDTLTGPDVDITWTLTGRDAGHIGAPDFAAFTHVENLVGGLADDTFVVEPDGGLTGRLEGGHGAFDTLVLNGGTFQRVTHTVSGPQSGTVVRDGATIAYAGLEPIADNMDAQDRILVYTAGSDGVHIVNSPTSGSGVGLQIQPLVRGAFESLRLGVVGIPGHSLTIETGAGADTVVVDWLDPDLAALLDELHIDTGAENDRVVVALPSEFADQVFVNGGTGVDALEDHTLMVGANVSNIEMSVSGTPAFLEEGPGQIISPGAASGMFPLTGAINSLAIHPFNAAIMYAGTVNGGIWLSEDGGNTWRTRTDQLPSLSIGFVAIAPRDESGNAVTATTPRGDLVLYAGTGNFSSFDNRGGFNVGLYRSEDGGDTWSILSPVTLAGLRTTAVVPVDNGSNDPEAQTILVSTRNKVGAKRVPGPVPGSFIDTEEILKKGGVFRSTDSGKTFSRVLEGSAFDLVADPGVPGRLYASINGQGVFRTDNFGGDWEKINDGLTLKNDNIDNDGNRVLNDDQETVEGAGRIRLAVRQDPASNSNTVFAALVSDTPIDHLMGVFSSTPGPNPNDHTWSLVGQVGVVAPAPPEAELTREAATPTQITFAFGGNPRDIQRDRGDWRTDRFAKGQTIRISNADAAGNNGAFLIDQVISDKVIRLAAGTALTAGTENDIAITAEAAILAPGGDQQPQVNLGDQGERHFSIVADGVGNLFIGGDRGVQAAGFPGNLYAFTATDNQWTSLVNQTSAAAVVRPHADSRVLVLNPVARAGSAGATAGLLFDGNDGGIYQLDLSTRNWANLNQDGPNDDAGLRITELLSVAYDPLNNLIFGGAQDNGRIEQSPLASDEVAQPLGDPLIDDAGERFVWDSVGGGDGNTVAIAFDDTDGNGTPDHVVRFVLGNDLDIFLVSTYDHDGFNVDTIRPALRGPGGQRVNVTPLPATDTFSTAAPHGLKNNDGPFVLRTTDTLPTGLFESTQYFVRRLTPTTFQLRRFSETGDIATFSDVGVGTLTLVRQFTELTQEDRRQFRNDFTLVPYVVNAIDSNRVLLGLHELYESKDRLENLEQLPELNNQPTFSALAYGGTKEDGGTAHRRFEVIYAAAGNDVFIRLPESPASATIKAFKKESIKSVREIRDIVLDPRDYEIAYAVTDGGVFKRVGSDDWQLISQKLFNANLQTIEFIPREHLRFATGQPAQDVLLVGGAVGVHRAFDPQKNVVWTQVGRNLPNALVIDLSFERIMAGDFEGRRDISDADVLLVGTQGRGAWTISAADVALAQPSIVRIAGTADADEFTVERNAANAAILDISVDGAPVFSSPILSVQSIVIDGGADEDTLTVDSTNGAIFIPGGISFTGGTGVDQVILQGGKVHDVEQETAGAKRTITVEDTRGGAKQVVVFEDFQSGTDIITDNLEQPGTGERILDFLKRVVQNIPVFGHLFRSDPAAGARVELAVLSKTLPGVISGDRRLTEAPIADPEVLLSPQDVENVASLDGEGIGRMFRFEDGTNLLDLGRDGTVVTLADLLSRLQQLAGVGNVTNTGTDALPRIVLTLNKTLQGSGDFDVAFDQFGGHVELKGLVEVSVDVQLNLIFGLDSDGIFIETNGALPEVAISNIQLTGALDGSGQFGFLSIELTDPELTINGVSIALDLVAPTGNKIRLGDLANPAQLDQLAELTVTGPPGDDVVLTAGVEAQALLPGMSAPFDLGDASVTLRWEDIRQPTAIQAEFSGGIGDFLKVGVDEFLAQLRQFRDHAEAFGVDIPFLRRGLDELISLTEAFDEKIVQPLTDGVSGTASFGTAQDLARRVSNRLNQDLETFNLGFSGGALTWDFHLDRAFLADEDIDLEFDLAEGLADVDVDAEAEVETAAAIDFTLGLDFTKLIDLGNGTFSIADAFFIQDASASAALRLHAEDINASARLGFINAVIEGGTADAEIGLAISLTDPSENPDGRITLDELIDAVTDDIGRLIGDPVLTGSAHFSLPLGAPFLGIDPDPATTAIVVDIPDLANPTDVQVTLPDTPDFSEIFNFTRLDASSLVGLLGRLTFWLDEFRKSEQFASFDVPLVGPALDQVLGFADAVRDSLLFDDGDDGIDGVDKLTTDVNAGLTGAGLADDLRAEIDGSGRIKLIANTANAPFTVDGAPSTAGPGGYHAYTVPTPPPANGVLGADLVLSIAIGGVSPITVTVKKTDTDNNVGRGNDRWKLVDPSNAPTFSTVDELVPKLLEVSGLELDYNRDEDILSFTLDLSQTFGQKDFDLDFSLPNLPDFLDVQADGTVRVSADGSLNLTLGVFLGDAPSSTILDGSEPLDDLNGGVEISTERHITGAAPVRTVYGQLSADATFNVAIDGGTPVEVKVTKLASDDNATAADLASDINAALAAKELNTSIVAVAEGLRIALHKAAGSTLTAFAVTASSSDPAVKEIGFAASGTAALGPLKIVATADLTNPDGKLSADAHFSLTIDGVLPAVQVTVTKVATADNTTAAQLVTDINSALAAAGISNVVAALDGRRLRLQEKTAGTLQSLQLTAAALDAAVTQLRFATSQAGATGPLAVAATKDLTALRGRLTGNAAFQVSLNTVNGGATIPITVLAANTATNRFAFDIVNDVQAALDATALAGHIKVDFSNDRLTFATTDGATGFTITAAAGNPAVTELGLAASNPSNSFEFEIRTRGGGVHGITLDGLSTLGQVLTAIGAQTGGEVTAAINSRGTGIDLNDHSPDQGGTFEVRPANNSTAAIALGIVRPDALQGESPDGVIEGIDIGGLSPLDRFFIEADPAIASVGVHLSTPTLDAGGNVIDGDGDGSTGDDGLSGTAKFGFVGIDLTGGGTVGATLSLGLKDPGTVAADNRITLTELLGALDDLKTVLQAPALTTAPNSQILLDVEVNPALPGLTLGPNPRIGVIVGSVGDPFATPPAGPNIQFVFPDLGNLLDFGNLDFNFQSIVAGLQALVDFLGRFETFDFLGEPLPVIDVSIKDLVGVADRFATAIAEAQADPAGTVQVLERKLEGAFGLPQGSPLIDLVLEVDDNDTPGNPSDDVTLLRVNLDLSASFSESLGISLDVGQLLGLPDIADLGGAANLAASGGLDLQFDFGFDVSDPTQIFLFNTTGIDASLNATGDDLTFRAALGPLGLFVQDGQASLSAAISAGLAPALFPGGTNRVLLATVLGDLEHSVAFDPPVGSASATLPVFFPNDSVHTGDIALTWPDLFDVDTLELDVPDGLLDFDPADLSLLDQLLLGVDGIDLFLVGLQDVLDGEIGGVSLPLIGDKLAGAADVIGDVRADFLERFRQAVEDLADPGAAFAAAGYGGAGGGALAAAQADPVSQILFELLGPSGLGLLLDSDDAGADVSVADIAFLTNINDPNTAPEDLFFDWDFTLGDVLDRSAGIGFDIGIPGLGLETTGDVEVTLAWELEFGFGLNTRDGFFLDIGGDDDPELELNVDVAVPGGGITGTLGFLQLSAVDDTSDGDGLHTHLGATFAVDIRNDDEADDDKLGFSELGKLALDVGLGAEAVVDLGLTLSLSSDVVPSAPTNFPSIVADFTLEWAFGDRATKDLVPLADLDGSFLKNGLQFVGFENVGLDLGSYFSELIAPIAATIQDVTEPIKPFLDFLTEPIPVISDLAGPTSLLDLAAMSGFVNPGIVAAIEVIDQVADIANQLSVLPGGNAIMSFDEYLPRLVIYQAPVPGLLAASQPDLSNPNLDLADLKDRLLEGLDFLPEEIQAALGGVANALADGVNKMLPGGSASAGFSLPIIEDPSQVFGMLMSQPAVLVQYDMAALELAADYSAFFSLLGPLGVSINAEFDAQFGPFTFGYDTLGITEFAGGGFKNPLQLFDGFFVSDLDTKGNDVPELQFDAGLWAAAELNLAVARGGVGGGLFAEIDFNLHDPDDDGRVRLKELATAILNEFRHGEPALSPLAIFDISGKLTAELFAFLKIDLFLFSIDERWHITEPITLLDFANAFPRVPALATELGDGVLQLNMGKFAAQRVEGDLTDGDEHFVVAQKPGDSTHVLVWAPSLGIGQSDAQEYEAISLILALGGDGNDIIDLSGVTANLKYELEGNAGDDVITAGSGSGAARILGGAGRDTLTGGGGDDTIFGETGDDIIEGGGGRDWLFGDGDPEESIQGDVITISAKPNDGVDTIRGGDAADLIVGAGAGDTLEGGEGDDVLIGDGGRITVGADRLVVTTRSLLDPPQPDPDRLELAVEDIPTGNLGAKDVLRGDGGDDHLYAGVGDDELFGGADDDVMYGGAGRDTIRGEGGHDIAFGDFGTFTVVNAALTPVVTAGGDRDEMFGGTGDDKLLGGGGDDIIHGEADNDWLYGGTGSDTLHGEAGSDHLYGDSEPDTLLGGTESDYLEGGGGNDLVLGDTGNDLLVAGFGSDTLDGEEGSDTYRITARGGSITELSTAYDSGTAPGETDSLILIGTPQADTVLLRAMADFYFPTLQKLIGDDADPNSKGIVDRIFESNEPDKLAALLQAIEDAYGPHDLPAGLVDEIIDLFVADVKADVLGALTATYDAEPDPDPDTTAPLLADLIARLDDPDDPNDPEDPVGILNTASRNKLAEMQAAITEAYGEAPVPATMFDAILEAWNSFSTGPNGLSSDIEEAIAGKFQSEALVGLLAIVDQVFTSSAADKKQAVIDRIDAAYAGATPAALSGALDAADTEDGLKDAIVDEYDPSIAVPGIETDTGFVALINNGGANVERFNYRNLEGLVVNTLQGDDLVVSDDVIVPATVNLGLGEDRVQIGQVFRSERVKNPFDEDGNEIFVTNITAEDVFTTLEITRGWLSNGISRPLTVNGGDDGDQFTVFHNVAVLTLNGGDGDDVFTVRAFALKGSTDSERARTDMKGDGGADTILYVVNAPVGIDGGDGLDTVRVVGTEFADDFVVTEAGIFGAGLNVTFVNIEKLVADGAEGDDRFFVLSTGLEVVTEIDGGLGSDTFFVGGNPSRAPIPVIANDFRGHSGVILHEVESALSGSPWQGLPVEGISANVGDDEEDFILVTESGGSSRVVEGDTSGLEGWEFDTYSIRLTRAPGPGQTVTVNVVPAGMAPEDQARGFRDLEFYDPATGNTTPLGFDELTDLPNLPSLTFTEFNWFVPQVIKFRAVEESDYDPDGLNPPDSPLKDTASEGRRFAFINHTAQNSTDPDYRAAQILSVKVQMEDNDRDGVIVTPTGRGNTVLENGPGGPGFTDSLDVVLTRAPAPNTTVTVTMTPLNGQIALSQTVLMFTPNDWDTRRTVTITAPDDALVEGFHTDFISFTVASDDVDTIEAQLLTDVDGDFDAVGVQDIPPDKPTSYVLLAHRPIPGTVLVTIDGQALPADRFTVSGNTLSFVDASGAPELRTGDVKASYSFREAGYDRTPVRDTVVDIHDEDTPTVIVEQSDGSTDVVEEGDNGQGAKTDTYRLRLSRAPAAGETVTVVIDAVDTRTTFGRTARFVTQLDVAGEGEVPDADQTLSQVTFDASNWNVWKTVTVSAIDDGFFDGNDTQVFAPDLQTLNKIRGPLIIEGAAGGGSLSLPRPLMLPHELNLLEPDGNVVAFVAGAGGGAEETMTVERADLELVIDELQQQDSTIASLQDLVGKTLELSTGPGTSVVLDPLRPDDRFDRFWLIEAVTVLPDGDADPSNDLVVLTLQNPTTVDPSQPNITAPDSTSEYAITSLSINFFADEREQVDYLFAFDEDSVADDRGALTSSDGVVRSFDTPTNVMVVETPALQAVAKLIDPDAEAVDLAVLLQRTLEITVGPGLGDVWTISAISVGDGPEPGTKFVTLTPVSVGQAPTDRSEFRIQGGDTHGRITGFGMGPNILSGGRPQPGGITYGDIEVVDVKLGTGDDEVRVDYASNAEDHTTKRSGDFYTLTLLDTGAGDDEVAVTLTDGEDGAFAVNLRQGNDTMLGGASTAPLVAFGWEGDDHLVGGAGDDILFGDIGRVDYVRTVEVEVNGVLTPVDDIVTRLGHSEAQNPVNPPVTGATITTLSDANTTFPTAYGGLRGLSVQAISPQGQVQFRTIVANDAHTVTIAEPWDQVPIGHDPLPDPLPDANYFYRVSMLPEDQTDGEFRTPKVVRSINEEVGGLDTIEAGGGDDLVIGGAQGDNLDGGASADLVFGDNVRLDGVAGSGNAINPRFRALTGAAIYDVNGLAQVGAGGQAVPGGAPAWADLAITLDQASLASHFGDDYIAGGAGDDQIFGQLGDDTIQGDGSIASKVDGNLATPAVSAARVAGVLQVNPSFEAATDGDDYIEGNGGADVIFGNLGQDDLIGGNSSLFSLTSAALRPDVADLIFGGAATDIGRDDPGDTSGGGHARDADAIVGDNGNIFRLVVTNGVDTSAYLTFNYDTYPGALRLIPRAVQLLDYTPGGPDFTPAVESAPADVAVNPTTGHSDIGAADEIHGESGDDAIYGMVGADVLFGDGQDDSIVGGYGPDWMSGGTGDDGMLGDDGRIFASRNSTSFGEPLYGVAAIAEAEINKLVSASNGDIVALTNVENVLKYTVDLTPFSLDPTGAAPSTLMPRPLYANDIMYGGLGHDAPHGGAGDDAISGAEAPELSFTNSYDQAGAQLNAAPIPSDFSHPVNPGNVLGYAPSGPNATKFALYDANDPLRKILLTETGALSKTGSGLQWLLNFETEGPIDTAWIVGTAFPGVATDGDDHLFGDLDHDWLVGGTGRDTLWAGWGDDLANADDVLSTNGGLNSGPDTNPSWEDFVSGGAGRDVLVANTGGDRLVDWTGEFNTYVVPYNPFGLPVANRLFQPALEAFMYALGKSQGADPTLAAQYGGAAARNGEPFGELGLVRQGDAAFGDQSGAPRDPQRPNSNAKEDVRPSAGVQPLDARTVDLGPASALPSELAPIVDAAKLLWTRALGAEDRRLATLDDLDVQFGNLPKGQVAVTIGNVILIDSDAGGRGWFFDPTPRQNEEFIEHPNGLRARRATPAFGKIDLLTTVAHELGRGMGFRDVKTPGHVMAGKLPPGVRRLDFSSLEKGAVETERDVRRVLVDEMPRLKGTRAMVDWDRVDTEAAEATLPPSSRWNWRIEMDGAKGKPQGGV